MSSESQPTPNESSIIRKNNEQAMVEMMLVLVRALEERDAYTRGHSERVSTLALRIAQTLGYDEKDAERVRRGAMLHDIGKIGIPDDILNKPGSFSPEERASMNQHPEKGHLIILNCHLLWDLIPIVRNHHENLDGSGYPDKLSGEEIPQEVRIVSLADYFDALSTSRPYKKAFPKERCLDFIKENTSKKFDPDVVDAFFQVVDPFYDKYVVPLNQEMETQHSL